MGLSEALGGRRGWSNKAMWGVESQVMSLGAMLSLYGSSGVDGGGHKIRWRSLEPRKGVMGINAVARGV